MDPSPPTPLLSLDSPDWWVETQYGVVMDMVRKLHSELGLITLDNDMIRTVYEKLLKDKKDRDHAMCDLTGLVKRSLDLRWSTFPNRTPSSRTPSSHIPSSGRTSSTMMEPQGHRNWYHLGGLRDIIA